LPRWSLKSRIALLLPAYLACRRCHVDLRSAAAVKEFAAKQKQRDDNKDYENDEHGDNAGTRSATF
jgi:hypothetical protein